MVERAWLVRIGITSRAETTPTIDPLVHYGDMPDYCGRHAFCGRDDRVLQFGEHNVVADDVSRPDFLGIGASCEGMHDIAFGNDAHSTVGSPNERDADVELGKHGGERPQCEPLVDRNGAARHHVADGIAGICHHHLFPSL
jgi:hypothetical protein